MINVLQNLETFQKPKLNFEQYQTDAVAAADLMFHVTFERRDLDSKNTIVVDLGAGTGIFTVAAAILGSHVIAVDVDESALKILKRNIQAVGVEDEVTLLKKDANNISKNDILNEIKKKKWSAKKIVVITNPPFGVHNKGIDVLFLQKAMEIGDIVYSIHLYNEESIEFIEKKVRKAGGTIAGKSILYLTLPHSYKFHKKKRKEVKTIVFRVMA